MIRISDLQENRWSIMIRGGKGFQTMICGRHQHYVRIHHQHHDYHIHHQEIRFIIIITGLPVQDTRQWSGHLSLQGHGPAPGRYQQGWLSSGQRTPFEQFIRWLAERQWWPLWGRHRRWWKIRQSASLNQFRRSSSSPLGFLFQTGGCYSVTVRWH